MSLTVLSDVVMPDSIISYGVQGKSLRKNMRSANQGGFVTVNTVWTQTLRRFEFGFAAMAVSSWRQLEALFEVTEGGAYGFLLRDPKDSTVNTGEGLLQPYSSGNVGTNGFGHGTPVYRLSKRYSVVGSARTRDRRITRPIAGPAITRAGSPCVEGSGAGNYAIDLATGTVTFVADASQTASAITVGTTTQVQLAATVGLSVGGSLYLTGFTGADAALVNGQAFAITAIASSTYTLSVNTAGKTITAGGSAAGKKYPQPSEALAWTGAFYVPVQFESDEIDFLMEKPGAPDDRIVSGPAVAFIEVREP